MRRLLLLLLVTTIITLVAGAALRSAFLPFYWGCERCAIKVKFLREHPGTYDTLIFGDSRVEYHIDPQLLDAQVRNVKPLSSFNFGISSMDPLETLYLFEHLLKEDGLRPHYVLFQVKKVLGPKNIPYDTTRGRYWMSWPFVLEALRISDEVEWHKGDALKVWRKYFAGYALRFFGINAVDTWRKVETFAASPNAIGPRGRGFRSMDDQLHQLWLQDGIYTFHKDTKQYDRLVSLEKLSIEYPCPRQEDKHLEFYKRLLRLSEDYGIYPIFFVIPPHWDGGTLCILSNLPPEHRLIPVMMADHPEIFTQENFVNNGHLNSRSARAYTLLFAKSLTDLFRQIR
jgi:hypothetical protein